MRKSYLLSLLFVSLILTSCNGGTASSEIPSITSETPTTYTNPVWEPVLADPSVIRGDDGIYYAYGTQDNALWGDYYGVRYIPILKSHNLVDWEYADAVFKPATMPTWNETSGAGLWAPDIVKIGDTYNLYYSFSAWGDPNPGIGVATASHPLGPWTDKGKIFTSNEIGVKNSIDSAVFVDKDDRVYMMWGSFVGIYAVELTSDGLSLKDTDMATAAANKTLIAGVDNGQWQIGNYEAAYITHENNFYYLYLSTGTCCEGLNSSYEVRVARSESILGPYVDKAGNNMTSRQNIGTPVVKGNADFVGVGHNSVVKDDAGDEWIIYHGFDTKEPAHYGNTNRRTLLIDKLQYDNDLWPSVAGLGATRGATRPTIN
ncbi:MAG: family 43 glycosylhydrolase [Bacilli bacterium]|nr:family 43 glycosylhydrolase [Bacilli bacterium]